MAIIRKNELKQMNDAVLRKRLEDLRKEMIKINAQLSTGTPPENPGRVREVKKTIARILTNINQKSEKTKKSEEVKKSNE